MGEDYFWVGGASSGFSPDIELNLRAAAGNAQILPGKSTAVWGYQASLAERLGYFGKEEGSPFLGKLDECEKVLAALIRSVRES